MSEKKSGVQGDEQGAGVQVLGAIYYDAWRGARTPEMGPPASLFPWEALSANERAAHTLGAATVLAAIRAADQAGEQGKAAAERLRAEPALIADEGVAPGWPHDWGILLAAEGRTFVGRARMRLPDGSIKPYPEQGFAMEPVLSPVYELRWVDIPVPQKGANGQPVIGIQTTRQLGAPLGLESWRVLDVGSAEMRDSRCWREVDLLSAGERQDLLKQIEGYERQRAEAARKAKLEAEAAELGFGGETR